MVIALDVEAEEDRERERHAVVYGAKLKVREGQEAKQGQLLVEWDPYSFTILTEDAGSAVYRDIVDGQTVHEQVDENTGMSALVIIESPDEKKQPRIEVRDAKGKVQKKYLLPSGAHLMIEDGAAVTPGDVLAKIPRETAKTKDITGGLPRVAELFEARRPKEPAVITEIDGVVEYGDVAKQHRKIFVTGEDGEKREYQIPRGAHINVQEGERVRAGEALMDGPIDPHDILRVKGGTLYTVTPEESLATALRTIAAGSAKSPREKDYLLDCLQTANWLVKSLDQRARTISCWAP